MDGDCLNILRNTKLAGMGALCPVSGNTSPEHRTALESIFRDFTEDTLVPFGILLPVLAELFLFFSSSRLTSDFIVDCLEQWWSSVRDRFAHIQALVINQDNGPENHSRRTQFLKRIVEFAHKYHLNIRLAYYPPYYSKYNPIERTWGVLEQHWHGSLLDEVETVLNFAQTMTWKGKHPIVTLSE
jgi:hypothetical protein